ncbi:MATE family efflux transporter [Vibrio sp. TH_r3]|uniref:MATE family efflux transporter n=1 Tax=Vibrio sp. TH_r3 TaxID=3082084 RepID=UPI0029556AF1|nr:MATE family efflux transporter [Vibrio sp. TH_r3]MDV7104360.1 MATE family efflux transporter [Vibrio sp. TH_r3]
MALLDTYTKKNIALAWPLALNGLLMQSMLMIDTLLVSPLGEESVAAMGVSSTIVSFVLSMQMALAMGSQIILSRAYGSANIKNLNNGFFAGLSISSGFACLFMLIILIFGDNIVDWIIEPDSIRTLAYSYLDISLYVIFFTALTQITIALFNGMGKTKIPFKGYLIEMPFNTVLSYLFIYQLDMGVSGAALGSVCAIVLRTCFLGYCLINTSSLSLTLPNQLYAFMQNTRKHIIEILPFAANTTILAIGATLYLLLYSQLNINEYVAITLLYPWIQAGGRIISSWSYASAILISQQIGSGKLGQLEKSVNSSIDIAVWLSVLCSLFFVCVHYVFPHLYTELASETYLAVSIIAPLYIFQPLVRGYNTIHGNILRAVGKTTSVFKINFVGQWIISLPLLAIIIFVFDGSIFWAFAVQPFEEIVKAFPFRALARKTVKEFNSEQANKLNFD